MSELVTFLRDRYKAFRQPVDELLLRNGQSFRITERTFTGRRMAVSECYRNAAMMAQRDKSLTYVEGYVAAIIPIQHAWVVRDGEVIDPTIRGDVSRVTEYYGIKFDTQYLTRCTLKNKCYGLLDPWYNRKTIKTLVGEMK